MDENLVGYLLNALDPDTQREVETHLKKDPAAQQRLEALKRALEPLSVDREPPAPAPGLAIRTLARVAEYRCRPLPQAPLPPPGRLAVGGRRWYRRVDVLVAACLLVIVAGVGLPTVIEWNERSRRTACAGNLSLFHQALASYSDNHNQAFPSIEPEQPRHVAGAFVPMLKDAEVLPQGVSTTCPGSGSPQAPRYSMKDLSAMSPEEFQAAAKGLSGCYAYSLGYQGVDNSTHCGLRRNGDFRDWNLPIMADRPSVGPGPDDRGNTPNHRGGQNVLYIDGSVRFCTNPEAGYENDHIYVNKKGKVAAGINQLDTVLGCSDDRP